MRSTVEPPDAEGGRPDGRAPATSSAALPAAAAAATAAAGLLYALVIVHEGEPLEPVTWIVWGSVVLATAAALAGRLVRPLFWLTAAVDLTWALLGALSIGVTFVPGAMLAIAAARRRD